MRVSLSQRFNATQQKKGLRVTLSKQKSNLQDSKQDILSERLSGSIEQRANDLLLSKQNTEIKIRNLNQQYQRVENFKKENQKMYISDYMSQYFSKQGAKSQIQKQSQTLDKQIRELQKQIYNARTKISEKKYLSQKGNEQKLKNNYEGINFNKTIIEKQNIVLTKQSFNRFVDEKTHPITKIGSNQNNFQIISTENNINNMSSCEMMDQQFPHPAVFRKMFNKEYGSTLVNFHNPTKLKNGESQRNKDLIKNKCCSEVIKQEGKKEEKVGRQQKKMRIKMKNIDESKRRQWSGQKKSKVEQFKFIKSSSMQKSKKKKVNQKKNQRSQRKGNSTKNKNDFLAHDLVGPGRLDKKQSRQKKDGYLVIKRGQNEVKVRNERGMMMRRSSNGACLQMELSQNDLQQINGYEGGRKRQEGSGKRRRKVVGLGCNQLLIENRSLTQQKVSDFEVTMREYINGDIKGVNYRK